MALETNSNHDIDVTESLIEQLQDSVNGYQDAASLVEDQQLAAFFRQRAASRRAMVDELSRILVTRRPSEAVERDGTIIGQLHQGFMKLRAVIQDDERAALAEVDRGERHLVEKVQRLLEKDVSVELRNELQALLTTLESESADIDRLKELA